MKQNAKLSLKVTLIAQFVLCALLPLLILSVYFISSFRNLQIDQQIAKQSAISQNVMGSTQYALDKATTALLHIARDKNVALAGQSGLFGYSAANTLNDFVMEHNVIATAVLIDGSGFIVEAAPEAGLLIEPLLVITHMESENFTRSLSITSKLVHSPTLAQALFTRTRSLPQDRPLSGYIMMFSVPLFLSETERLDSRSTFTGHIVALALAEDIVKLIYQRSAGLQLGKVLIDDVSIPFETNNQTTTIISTDASFVLSDTNINIAAQFFVQEHEALAPIDDLTYEFALYASAISVLFVALGFFFVRLELKPLVKLNQMVQEFRDGNFSYQQGTLPFTEFTNVTALLTEMADNIRDYQEDLEAKVQLRTEALESALAEVKKINRELIRTQNQLVESEKMSQIGVLVAGVAHEVNTPIGVCVTATSILDDRLEALKLAYSSNQLSRSVMTDFIEQASNCVEILNKNTERAADLIQSFKAVSVDQSSEQKRTFNVADYIDLILRSLHKELERHSVEVAVEGSSSCNIETYPGALSQILSNLVLNAIKHGFNGEPTSSDRRIQIKFELNENKQLALTFKDNGRGVHKDALPKLFEPFFTTSRQTGGSGLGLSIVYNLATQRLGGSINCTSELGEGLCIVIVFPVKVVDKPDAAGV
ncbi:sensor histidine kinase [Alteromonas facilis]|uniref:sensor histidine kinase n=1 Tax=Alteromonas facilis TaxID=2048004 RepID=UPI000C28A23E|nr:HAMP domain-containing sensor histidine kinase [Alteromonas facilis]